MNFSKKCTDNRKKNPTREISRKVAEKVIERDKTCIICRNSPIEQIHHAKYGLQREFDEGRNGVDRLVGLCNSCHYSLHFTDHVEYRQFTLDYLKNIYF